MLKFHRTNLQEKLMEALKAVLPIIVIVLLLGFTLAPLPSGVLTSFLIGSVLLILGMMFFTLGADLSMTTIGERVGTAMTRSRKLQIVLPLSFFLGFIITISEPDLQVLAEQVPSVPNSVLILVIACGVGLFLVVALLRMLIGISLSRLLIFFYLIVFLLAFFVPDNFLAVAFDAGGVTTGPMTVPFIMSLGVGIAAIRSDKHAADDSFGLVALCSIGPVLSVLLLALIFSPEGTYLMPSVAEPADSIALWQMFYREFPSYMKEIAIALLPIIAFFAVFQIAVLKLDRKTLVRIIIGLVYTYVGLVLFLTGVNVGFMPAGILLGELLMSLSCKWLIVPVGTLIGYFIVMAEPAVHVLTQQVEEITSGSIPASAMRYSLSIGVAVSVGLSMIRVLAGFSILWFLIPGYGLALGLSFLVPKIFTAIAFDSGGVASGPMTTTFLLPFAIGACSAAGGSIVSDAFGIVAMVAMTPLITIQVLGVVYQFGTRHTTKEEASLTTWDIQHDFEIMEL